MCQFTLVRHVACGHTKLLTDPANTILCDWVRKTLAVLQGWDVAPACCHPLRDPEMNQIATVHNLFGHCDDCWSDVIDEIGEQLPEKKKLLLRREGSKQALDFEVYDENDLKKIEVLRNDIMTTRVDCNEVVEKFELSLRLDTTLLALDPNVLGPGFHKYELLLFQALNACTRMADTLSTYTQQHVPRRMFDDMVGFIQKKVGRAAERAFQLSLIADHIKEDAGSGNHKEAIKYLTGDLDESLLVERMGTTPERPHKEFGYLEEPHDDPDKEDSCLEQDARQLVEMEMASRRDAAQKHEHQGQEAKGPVDIAVDANKSVPATRSDARPALPMRRGDFTAPLLMSTAKFKNNKLPSIMMKRGLRVVTTNIPQFGCPPQEDVPMTGPSSPGAPSSPPTEDQPENTTNGSVLLDGEPASQIEVTHIPFSEKDIKDSFDHPGRPYTDLCYAYCLHYDDDDDEEDEESSAAPPQFRPEQIGKTFGFNPDDWSDDDDDTDQESDVSDSFDEKDTLVDVEAPSEETDSVKHQQDDEVKSDADQDSASTLTQSQEQSDLEGDTLISAEFGQGDVALPPTPATTQGNVTSPPSPVPNNDLPQSFQPRNPTRPRTPSQTPRSTSASPERLGPLIRKRSSDHDLNAFQPATRKMTGKDTSTQSSLPPSAPSERLGPIIRKRRSNEDLKAYEPPGRKVKMGEDGGV